VLTKSAIDINAKEAITAENIAPTIENPK